MAHFLVRVIGVLCGSIGMILTWIITIMPQWRVTIIAENNGILNFRLDGQWISRLDGLWVTCINQVQITQLCNSYDSIASVPTDLKAGRVFMSIAIIMTVLAFLFSLVGMLFNRCDVDNLRVKHCLLLTSGIVYILSAMLIAIPVSWTTSNVVSQTCDAIVCRGSPRLELGEALFLAWPTIAFLLIGGIILCWICPCRHKDDRCVPIAPHNQEMVCMVRRPEGTQENCYNKTDYI
ncbi:hypothetical protein GDO86_002785 [Hymenochirus boettgeri]|uniref:Claudin n=1 Tax=Hymenochirus boettgeri TaxID=247094 RepID=A0A8T2K0W9_9PIPI|nr:hypothetical protein GDO86_002785 [Hymenochirus boettgeri]